MAPSHQPACPCHCVRCCRRLISMAMLAGLLLAEGASAGPDRALQAMSSTGESLDRSRSCTPRLALPAAAAVGAAAGRRWGGSRAGRRWGGRQRAPGPTPRRWFCHPTRHTSAPSQEPLSPTTPGCLAPPSPSPIILESRRWRQGRNRRWRRRRQWRRHQRRRGPRLRRQRRRQPSTPWPRRRPSVQSLRSKPQAPPTSPCPSRWMPPAPERPESSCTPSRTWLGCRLRLLACAAPSASRIPPAGAGPGWTQARRARAP